MTGYDRDNTNLNYEDIINLPHPVSKRHKPMPVEDRAAQFAQFAALTGHQAAIEEAARVTDIRMELDEEMKEQYERIEKSSTKQEIIEIKEKLISDIEKDNINKRLTLNLFKSILSNTYYGQPSFLNVIKTSISYEGQQELMYRDYVSNIVETGFINGIMKNDYSIEQI